MLSYTGAFHKNLLSIACCTFGVFEVITIKPNRFKNESSDTVKTLAHNCNHQQELVKQKLSLSIIVGLRQNFLNTFIKIAVLGKIYQCTVVAQNWNNTGLNVTPNRFKNQTNDRLKLLGHN